jgi:Icc-related predicted phosphoesterase
MRACFTTRQVFDGCEADGGRRTDIAHLWRRNTAAVRVACAADLHEHLVEVPECDLLVIAGDLTYAFGGSKDKRRWLAGPFAEWLAAVPAREVVVVAGNHDVDVERDGFPDGLRCRYLQDEGAEVLGLTVWGTPWQPWFYGWAFNAPRDDGEVFLAEKFAAVPAGADIVVCHGPPLGYGDSTRGGRAGSSALTETVDRVAPPLLVCGHIHSGAGRFRRGATEIVNAALVDDRYELVNRVELVELATRPAP